MINMRPLSLLGSRQNYRPMPFNPALMPGKAMGQTGVITALGVVPLLAMAGAGGVIAWAAFNWASKSKETLPKVIGYPLGVLGALGALGGTLGAILWATMVQVGQAASDASAQRSADFMQRTDTAVQRSTWDAQRQMDQFMNQQQSTVEQFAEPMTLPTTPLPM